MAQDGEPPKSVDKGKGKATDGEPSNAEDVKKDKDGKPIVNGKMEDKVTRGMLPALVHFTFGSLITQHPRSSVRKTNNSRASWICLWSG